MSYYFTPDRQRSVILYSKLLKKPFQSIPKFSLRGEIINCQKQAINPFFLRPSQFSNPYSKTWVSVLYERGNTVMHYAAIEKWLPRKYHIMEQPPSFTKKAEIDEGPKLVRMPQKICQDNTLPVIVKSAR